MIKDFVIPLNKDELLQSREGQYFVEKVIPSRMVTQALDATRTALQTEGACFIIDHFDTFFAVVVHGNKVELQIIMRAFTRIFKAIEVLVQDMETMFEKGKDIGEEERSKFLCVNKMLAYLFSWFVCYINEEILKNTGDKFAGKRKKSVKSDAEEQWEANRQKALEYVYRWLQLPLQKLWQPPIVEDSFITLLTKVCYKVLEECKDAKQKHTRQTIFEILGTCIKKYNQGITCVVRIIQLVKLNEILAAQMATGVVHMVTDCGCNGLIREVMKEIDQGEVAEADSRNISIFLEGIATTQPDLIIPILGDITDHLSSEHYTMRNCTIGILGAVVQKALTGEDLTEEQKERRDECLDNLEEHILDCNAYVRSKVLQVWQRLCCEGAIPLARQGKLLALTALRLEDKSANVRKQALQLLRALLQSNPFAAKLNRVEISKSLEEEEMKLKKLQTEGASKSARGDNQRLELWNTLLPDIRKALKQVIIDKGKEQEDSEDENEDIDPDKAFERVRQLMLKGKILAAVKYLWKICIKFKQASEMEGLSPEAKEECLFLLLLKTFMESEDNVNDVNDKPDNAQSEERKKYKEDIKARKRVVNYLRNCLEFATELEAAIPMAEKLLFSTTASDAVEACTLLGTAYQFGVAETASAVRDALFQVFHRDQSVRNNVAEVYKEIYLKSCADQRSERQRAVICAKALIDLLKGLQPGQSPALSQLVITWYKNQELDNEVLQVLWEQFSMKSPDSTAIDSRAALMLITMIAQAQSGIITGNLDVLIKVGLGQRAKTDLLLARDTCRALLRIKQENTNDIEKLPMRYPNDHEMFKEILILLKENFLNMEEDGYVSFATDAINVIYHLANQPDCLMKQLLVDVFNKGQFKSTDPTQQPVIPFFLLSKLLYLIGHIAIKQMVHLDTSVYKELKRRDTIRKLRKEKASEKASDKNEQASRKSRKLNVTASTPSCAAQSLRNKETSTILEDNGEEAVEGAQDDADAEFIHSTLENQVVSGDGLLARFVPLVLDVCQHPDKYNNESLQAAGTLTLSKMMTVSSTFCEESLQLLVTILERSPHPGIRANVLIGLSDLTTRFPNQVEPWMKHVYGRLRDENVSVRGTCVRVLSNLIMREMVRVRGQVSELALCIVDKDNQIRQDAKQFFKELSQKGNALYNVMPDILSRLTDPELRLDEDDFQEVLKYILGLLQKEKQVDAIIDKICARFKLATTERQWRDFAFCLSLLQFSGKSIRRLIESLPLLKDKIHNAQVLKALQTVIEQTKKKPNSKAACEELEEKIKELLEATENTEKDNEAMPPPPVPKPKKTSRRVRRKNSSEEEEDDYDSESDTDTVPVTKGKENKKRKSYERKGDTSSDSESDDNENITKTPAKSANLKRLHGRKKLSDSLDPGPSPLPKRNKQAVTPLRTSQRSSARLSQSRIRQ